MKVYIIGNGFDKAHKLCTGYNDYREYIKKHLKTYWKWEQILVFYPDDYLFWSDIEYNVCLMNKELYLHLKEYYSFGLLDDLERQIHKSFENFILDVENTVLRTHPYFKLDKDSLFMSFNYTSTLEDVYGVNRDNIIYVHNDISGPAFDILYNIPNHAPCIIGHSPTSSDYKFYQELAGDKEYMDFVRNTTKQCDEIIKSKNIKSRLASIANRVSEVVFYGFSFSLSDKEYVQLIFGIFSRRNIPIKIYYKQEDNETEEQRTQSFINRLINYDVDYKNVEFVNSDSITEI